MAFSEKLKLEVKRKSNFRCVVCNNLIVQVHHIIPQEEDGPDTIENAAALCAHCHNIYGNNAAKRKELLQIRDATYKRIEEKMGQRETFIKLDKPDGRYKTPNEGNDILLRVNISEKDDFYKAANKIYNLIYNTQKRYPNRNRTLIVEIKGHRNSKGGYDNDMFELQFEFLTKSMLRFIHVLHMPIISIENSKTQEDLISDRIMIFDNQEEMLKVSNKLRKRQISNVKL